MMNALKVRAESYNEWALNVNEALEAKINKKKSTWCRQRDVVMGDWGPVVTTPDPPAPPSWSGPAASRAEEGWRGHEAGTLRHSEVAVWESCEVMRLTDRIVRRQSNLCPSSSQKRKEFHVLCETVKTAFYTRSRDRRHALGWESDVLVCRSL